MADLLVGLGLALVLGGCLYAWRRAGRVPPRDTGYRPNLDRRVAKAMLAELNGARLDGAGKKWTKKQMQRRLREQLRAERNGDAS